MQNLHDLFCDVLCYTFTCTSEYSRFSRFIWIHEILRNFGGLESRMSERKWQQSIRTQTDMYTHRVHAKQAHYICRWKLIRSSHKTCWRSSISLYFAVCICMSLMSLQISSNWLFRMFKGIPLRPCHSCLLPLPCCPFLFDPQNTGIQWLAFHELLID